MLKTNNPFLFASSSAANPFATVDAVASAPVMPESFAWAHLLVSLAMEAPALPAAPAPAPEPEAAAPDAPAAPVLAAPVEVVPAPVPAAVAAPAPAIVTIAEPAPLPAPSAVFVPPAMPQDPAFDAYARMFQGIGDRDLLADLRATLAPGSDWASAFGPPLG